MISRTLHQKVIAMRRYNLNVTLYQFGLFIALGSLTMVTLNLILSGDSMTQKQEPTMLQSIQKQKVK